MPGNFGEPPVLIDPAIVRHSPALLPIQLLVSPSPRMAFPRNDMVGRVNAAEIRRVERERVQALGEIAGAVAHELMSPIMAILGEAREDPIDPARIRAEADHARRVIRRSPR